MSQMDGAKRSEDLAWGLILLGLGVYFLLVNVGAVPLMWKQGAWTWFVIGAGLVTLVTARSASRVGDGVAWTLIGAWMWIASTRQFGLNWGSSWPLALVAVGLGILARGAAGMFLPDRLTSQGKGCADA